MPSPQANRTDEPSVAALSEAEIGTIVDEVAERGFVVREGLIPDSLRTSLVQRIDGLMEELAVPFGENRFLGRHTRRIFNLLARDPLFERVPICPATLPVVDALLDDECLLSSLTAIEMHPGQAGQPLHSDDGSYGFPRPAPTSIVIAMWALTDFTRENGGTHVVPGSHRAARRPRRGDAPETIQVEMPAGSAERIEAARLDIDSIGAQGIHIPQVAHADASAVSGTYRELPPRNLKPLLKHPLMSAVQSAPRHELVIQTEDGKLSVSIPAAGVSGTASPAGDGLYTAELSNGLGKLGCWLRMVGTDKLILYLSEERFYQLTYGRAEAAEQLPPPPSGLPPMDAALEEFGRPDSTHEQPVRDDENPERTIFDH